MFALIMLEVLRTDVFKRYVLIFDIVLPYIHHDVFKSFGKCLFISFHSHTAENLENPSIDRGLPVPIPLLIIKFNNLFFVTFSFYFDSGLG